jgi:hypothetical protein
MAVIPPLLNTSPWCVTGLIYYKGTFCFTRVLLVEVENYALGIAVCTVPVDRELRNVWEVAVAA